MKKRSKKEEKLVRELKKHPEVTNPWALAKYLLKKNPRMKVS